MVDDDRANAILGTLLPSRLEQFQRASGLPVVLAGTTRRAASGRQITLNHFRGTIGDSLRDLGVDQGRGLGGTVVVRGAPRRVNDYAEAAITHEYDRMVVDGEKITSIFAFPVTVDRVVRGVLYGAVRDRLPIGDVALRTAGAVATQLSRDLDGMLRRPTDPVSPHDADGPANRAAAMAELGALTQSVTNPMLRRRLSRIHQALTATGATPDARSPLSPLSPRELDVLRLVAVGRTNREIAPQLGLRPETVKSYLRSAMRKLEVANRTAAVHAGRSVGIL